MPYTRTNTTIISTVNELDTFIPNESYLTLSDALAEYAITLSETVSVTDGSWHTLSLAPTAKGACIIEPHSTNISAVFVCSKNSSSNNVKYQVFHMEAFICHADGRTQISRLRQLIIQRALISPLI